MVIQHLFAFSGSVDGAGIAAGSPYGCGVQSLYSVTCYFGGLNTVAAVRYARRRHVQNLIDDPINLKGMPVVLVSRACLGRCQQTTSAESCLAPDSAVQRQE